MTPSNQVEREIEESKSFSYDMNHASATDQRDVEKAEDLTNEINQTIEGSESDASDVTSTSSRVQRFHHKHTEGDDMDISRQSPSSQYTGKGSNLSDQDDRISHSDVSTRSDFDRQHLVSTFREPRSGREIIEGPPTKKSESMERMHESSDDSSGGGRASRRSASRDLTEETQRSKSVSRQSRASLPSPPDALVFHASTSHDTSRGSQSVGESSDHSMGQSSGSSRSVRSSLSEMASSSLPTTVPIPSGLGEFFSPHILASTDARSSESIGHLQRSNASTQQSVGAIPLSRVHRADISAGLVHPVASASMAASSIMASQGPPKGKSTSALRRGKWTVEEEAYVARVIQDFNSGFLNAPAGTTLRSYLSEKLHCDPMRITKKFTGDSCIGKRVFHPAVRCASNAAVIDKAQAELDALERRWRRRLEMQQRESAKKAAASAAAAAAAASGRTHLHGPVSQTATAASVTGSSPPPQSGANSQQIQHNVITRTASWLDRANAILSGQGAGGSTIHSPQISTTASQDHAQAVRALPPKEIEDQMKEVQRLIHEGPIIQQTTAGLPHLLDQGGQAPLSCYSGSRKVTNDPLVHGETGIPSSQAELSYDMHPSFSGQDMRSVHPPLDKRPRTTSSANTSGAEDAEALVGFLNSVRASAAASTQDLAD